MEISSTIDFSQNNLTSRGGGRQNIPSCANCIAIFTSSASTFFFFAKFEYVLASSNSSVVYPNK